MYIQEVIDIKKRIGGHLRGLLWSVFLVSSLAKAQTHLDVPFIQDYSDKFMFIDEGNKAQLWQVRSDRNQNIRVLSTAGLLQPWEKQLQKDFQYRYLNDTPLVAMEVFDQQFVYLTDKAVLSNAWAGKLYLEHGLQSPTRFAMGKDHNVLVAANDRLALFKGDKKIGDFPLVDEWPIQLIADDESGRFLVLTEGSVYQLGYGQQKLDPVYKEKGLTSLVRYDHNIVLGTDNGIVVLDGSTYREKSKDEKLPGTEVTVLRNINGNLWFGSKQGAFKLRADGKYDYYASKRWLLDDEVVDIFEGPDRSVLVLTTSGLNQINFVEMTLAEKADYFQNIQRTRHIRYGFSAEVRLREPGNLGALVYTDDDNDGLWTSMYLAGELFRYAVTKSEDAKQNAYEAFEAMERLTEISGIPGFPARTYELDGYQSSDTDPNMPEDKKIWRLTKDERWRWKSTTSSDESCGHFFVYALFAELAPDKEWRDRAIHQIKIQMDHIIDNNWYLVTWNGKPTEWGRWNPKYVNSFPINVGDRRLNSTLILTFLQTAYRFTGDMKYKKEAQKLIKKYGYDENANRPATIIGFQEGELLSDTWNHSDDEMYFLTAPAFVKYSFDEKQRENHFESVRSHWEVERSEKNPLWNFLYALSGGKDYDLAESIWWLKEFPLDLLDWNISNSHRKDLVKVAPNFRRQEYAEILPRDERPMHLHNNEYINNGGNNGLVEYPPYIYLLPYWAGRYVEAISAPVTK